METLKNLVYDLDNELGNIGSVLSSLGDAKDLFLQLAQSMDIAVHRGEEKAYYQEHHRMVRVLSELVYYLVNDLNTNYEKVENIRGKFFNEIVHNEEKVDSGYIGERVSD